MHTVYTNLL